MNSFSGKVDDLNMSSTMVEVKEKVSETMSDGSREKFF